MNTISIHHHHDQRADAGSDRPPSSRGRAALRVVLHRWPTLVGLVALAGSSVTGPDAHIGAMVIILAAMCYVAAAAIGRRGSAWIVALAASVAVAVGMVTPLDTTLLLIVSGVVFGLFGLVRGSRINRRELGIQAAAFVGFTLVALSAMMVGPVAALQLAALAAIGHATWDVIHLRRDKVVARSLAEFCVVFDLGMGLLLLATAWLWVL